MPPNDRETLRERLMKRFGISLEEWDALMAAQGGVCAICGEEGHGYFKGLLVDRNPETGAIRGLLCPADFHLVERYANSLRMQQAALYLSNHP